jgi:hypothetical protein
MADKKMEVRRVALALQELAEDAQLHQQYPDVNFNTLAHYARILLAEPKAAPAPPGVPEAPE